MRLVGVACGLLVLCLSVQAALPSLCNLSAANCLFGVAYERSSRRLASLQVLGLVVLTPTFVSGLQEKASRALQFLQ